MLLNTTVGPVRVFKFLYADGVFTYEGSDSPYVSDGRPSENVWDGNTISNTEIGVKITDADSNVFTGESCVCLHMYHYFSKQLTCGVFRE